MDARAHQTLRVAVAVSGSGRTLRHLCEQQHQRAYQVAALISSNPHCMATSYGREQELPLFVNQFGKQAAQTMPKELESWLQQQQIDLVVLAGFLKPFPSLPTYDKKIVNIHPALLPLYGGKGMYGIHVHRAVLAGGESYSGATVHYVSDKYDEGAIIAQIKVKIAGLKDPEALAARVFAAECELYPAVLDGLAMGRLPLPYPGIYLLKENNDGRFTSEF